MQMHWSSDESHSNTAPTPTAPTLLLAHTPVPTAPALPPTLTLDPTVPTLPPALTPIPTAPALAPITEICLWYGGSWMGGGGEGE